MSEKEYYGVSEQEAVALAAQELGLPAEMLRYTITETKKRGLFSKGGVRISVNTDGRGDEREPAAEPASDEIVARVLEFVNTLIQKMGFEGKAVVTANIGTKIMLAIESNDSSLLIGKMGKTLDSLQVLVNIVAQNASRNATKVIIDCENYRERRQQKILDFADEMANQVRRTKSSRLLEPMNPFERRLIHTALTRYEDIETVSEGEGLYKQIRIRFRGRRN